MKKLIKVVELKKKKTRKYGSDKINCSSNKRPFLFFFFGGGGGGGGADWSRVMVKVIIDHGSVACYRRSVWSALVNIHR